MPRPATCSGSADPARPRAVQTGRGATTAQRRYGSNPGADPQDCDDTNPNVRPGGSDIAANGIDEDCDGVDAAPPADCDDGSDYTIDTAVDGGCTYHYDAFDFDGDGYTAMAATGGTPDCDDTNADVHPGKTEVLGNEIDDDCDGNTD